MKPAENLGRGAQIAIMALVVLGLMGGSLVIAHTGFETSPKTRGVQPVFVPLPQAYLMVAAMYGQSFIGMLVLLRARKILIIGISLSVLGYIAAALTLISLWR
ncbi:MAG: hypothetical protein H7197_01165 [Vitreoscilla sp.]|nr:hypothetical protein [Polaromonas sp.]